MQKHAIIMAGGGGTRFWPLSRKSLPKQFLNLTGKDILINETVGRLSNSVDKGNIYIVTGQSHIATVIEATEGQIVPKHIISEPCARSTLACIGFASISIMSEYGDSVVVVSPSDAYIRDTDEFTKIINEAIAAAEQTNKLITIGISPTFPATGYGYIKYSNSNSEVKAVERFVEKPNKETAQKYIGENFLWNSGIFVAKNSVLLNLIKKYEPEVYGDIEKIGVAYSLNDFDSINKVYNSIKKISFDYAVAEPASLENCVAVIPGDFGWSDVGTWDMIGAIQSPDKDSNVCKGEVLAIDSYNNVIVSDKKLTAVLGINDIVIVDTGDALLVCDKSRAQEVGKIVSALEELNRNDLI